MNTHSPLAAWLKEARADFLVLAVLLVAIGGAASSQSGTFNLPVFILTVIGIVLAHASVNLFNEYSDWRTGIDSHTERTPFSGGSGMMQAGLTKPGNVRAAARGTLLVSFLIGIVLAFKAGWPVLALMAAGGVTIVFYTDYFAKWTLGEAASGITLGSLVVLGAYFVQTGSFSGPVIWASIPAGILTSLLLFLNEFPDAEADRAGGRRHIVIVFGKKRSSRLYALLMAVVYLFIGLGPVLGGTPRSTLLALLTLPAAVAAVRIALVHYDDNKGLLPAQGLNVAVVLATDFLLALGFLLG